MCYVSTYEGVRHILTNNGVQNNIIKSLGNTKISVGAVINNSLLELILINISIIIPILPTEIVMKFEL